MPVTYTFSWNPQYHPQLLSPFTDKEVEAQGGYSAFYKGPVYAPLFPTPALLVLVLSLLTGRVTWL